MTELVLQNGGYADGLTLDSNGNIVFQGSIDVQQNYYTQTQESVDLDCVTGQVVHAELSECPYRYSSCADCPYRIID